MVPSHIKLICMNLLLFEKRLDTTIVRKRLEIQEAVK